MSEPTSEEPPGLDPAALTMQAYYKAMAVPIGAAAMAMEYTVAALIVAAAEREAIDPERVFTLVETLADGFDSGLAGDSSGGAMTAGMLRRIRPTVANLVSIPSGAGRA